jgi:hypothetical protein
VIFRDRRAIAWSSLLVVLAAAVFAQVRAYAATLPAPSEPPRIGQGRTDLIVPVPALMRLVGEWNWWVPRPLARLLPT